MSERFIKFELIPIPAVNSVRLPAFSIMITYSNAIATLLMLLVFASIIPYASEPVWAETLIFSVIFILCALCVLRKTTKTPTEILHLLTPVYLLAVYSFLQGAVTIYIQHKGLNPEISPIYSDDLNASLRSALKIASFAGFIWLVTVFFQSKIKKLVIALVATGNFFALFGIIRFLLQNYFPAVHSEFVLAQLLPDKGFGTYLNQNHFAYLMLMTLGLNISFLRATKFIKRSVISWLALSALTWIALILTGSRGGILSSFVEIAVLILLPVMIEKDGRNKDARHLFSFGKRLAGIGAIFVFFVLGVVLIGQGRVLHRFEELPAQIEGATSYATFRRIDVWQASLKMIGENWFSGIGFGGFHTAVSRYINISGQLAPIEAHNDYLEFIAAGGIIAVALGAWFTYRFYKSTVIRFNEQNSDFSKTVRLGAICGICGIALHSLVDFGLQIEANLLFFGALIYFAVHKSDEQIETQPTAKNNLNAVNYASAALFTIAAFYSAVFSFADYRLQEAKANMNADLIEDSIFETTFNADIYAVRAENDEKNGDYAAAFDNLQNAINYRPQDYELHLKYARTLQSQKQNEAAETAYLRALQLAPFYAQPYFYYGQFLLENKRSAEAFGALRISFQRNPNYFDAVAEMAWIEAKENPLETIKILSPLEPVEREYLAAVFFQKGEFRGFLNLTCREEDVNPPTREKIIRAFFEIKQYAYADLINKRVCDADAQQSRELEDGDFEEGKLQKKQGFGWRVGVLPPKVKIFLDGENAASGRQSLGVFFGGNYENPSYILSQTLIVKKSRKYTLSFSYKTSDLETKNFPVLQIVGKNSENEDVIKKIDLPPQESGWTRVSTDIQTNDHFDALEIRLTRESCGQNMCPIIGRLWLDAFHLQQKF